MMLRNLDKIVAGKKKKLQQRLEKDPDSDAPNTSSNATAVESLTKKQRKKMLRRKMACDDDNSDDGDLEEQVRQQIENEMAPASLPAKAVCIQIHTGK